ncbi:hypothetical protein [Bradyrhizobium sp. AZCC 1693]|uniref:hypothetical protein n=1 Tax=Bradyrhizobium sp. AZCC 1693 TaxID=3117029 RepID=UPI002FF2EE9D
MMIVSQNKNVASAHEASRHFSRPMWSLAVLVALILIAFSFGAYAQVEYGRVIKLHFGGTSFTIDRALIDYASSPRKLADIAWSATPEYEVAHGNTIALRLGETIPPALGCRQYLKTIFLKHRRPVDMPPGRGAFRDWEQSRTENPEIVKFITPPEENQKIDYYQFESDDLRDHVNRKQVFIDAKNVFPDTPSVILMDIIIPPEIEMRVKFSSRECFLREGPALTRHIRNLVFQGIR